MVPSPWQSGGPITLASDITEATVTSCGMWVGHFLDSNTAARGYRRTKIWSRLITWDSEIAAGDLLSIHAEARLEHMGL